MIRSGRQLLDTEDTPPQFRKMPFAKPTMEDLYAQREDRLTQDEVMDLHAASPDKMNRALVMTLLDTGFRAGEAAALNLEDVKFDDRGARILHSRAAKGLKTVRRKVAIRVVVAAPYLRDWIEEHPYRSNPKTPLFISRSNRNYGARLKSAGIWGIITRLAKHAKLRHVHPHLFRHTAASIRSSDGWNEEMMRLHFGWSKGSDMPSYYSHVEDDYDDFALRRTGIPVKRRESPSWSTECPDCGTENALDAYFCAKCGNQIMGSEEEAP